jgi:hypothetical protein
MRKKLFASIALAAIMSVSAGALSACFDNDDIDDNGGVNVTYPTVESKLEKDCDYTIYFDGEQTIVLSLTTAEQATQVTFNSTISASDITLSGVLVGKTVKSVTYTDSKNISVVLDGKVTADSTHASESGVITVSKNALSADKDYSCTTTVDFNPCMTCKTSYATGGNYRSYLYLPYGSYNESNVNTDNIVITNLTDGATVEVSLDVGSIDGLTRLKITVKGFTPSDANTYPVAQIAANVTSFNKAVTVNVGEVCAVSLI